MKAIQVITERDNVATALEALEPGRRLDVWGQPVIVREAIPRGHKLAVRPIGSGEPIVKYGSPIGTATADIPEGAHVHTHNVLSTRGRGDLAAAGRLAEPEEC
jgi:hypothetical protein